MEFDAAGLDCLTKKMADLLLEEQNTTPQQIETIKRETIWVGELEWSEKLKPDQPKHLQTMHCTVCCKIVDGHPEIKAQNWPSKLPTQIMPKHLLAKIGGGLLKNSRLVIFRPSLGGALDSLTKKMNSGYACCIHISSSNCNDKVIFLFYSPERDLFLGFIPNNQLIVIERIRKVVQEILEKQAVVT
ncbi:hypothetical protein M5D96_002745 [Drosophila gunungcola]|uniref:Mediator complex subunit Med25 PTOV domain-containing protein n=1 Tax=Drosophila gunungcola TaxID=103775 RepID=A0A9Q0BWQ7_9MUSC|nr:hypothetical protein M5D96_002745 [Drosophila gunungcola]